MRRLAVLTLLLASCAPSDPAPAAGPWERAAPLDVARSEHPAVVHDGELAVVGGFVNPRPGAVGVTATVESYDPAEGDWGRLADLPEPRHHAAATVVDGRLLVAGGFDESGFDPTATVWELVDGGWMPRAPLPEPVAAGAAVTVDGRMVVVGGVPCGTCVFAYDPSADTWSRLPDLGTAREHVAAALHGGDVWALGGRWRGSMHASTERLTDQGWVAGPEMTEARSGFGAVAVGGELWVAGGEVFDPPRVVDSVERLTDGGWELTEPLPVGLHGNPLAVLDGRLWVPGGSTVANGVDNPGTVLVRALP